MKKAKFALALLYLLVAGITATAQTTGGFDTSVTFMGSPRKLSVFVPATYNASTAYRLMVCLHGLGDNSANYRNALINSLAWNTNIPNTIFVCPEVASTNADYYTPAGGEGIIQASIDYAMAAYHIDTANVILQGFSIGGRNALRYGLDNYGKFKGLLLNTPAVQGVKEAINSGSFQFNYANAPHIPIYITRGKDDILYEAPVDSAYEQLILNNGVVRYFEFAGLGHAIPATSKIINFLSYFNNPAANGYDLDVVRATVPQRTCNTMVAATCLIRNTGTNTINSANLDYTVDGTTLSYTYTGALLPFQHAIVTLPAISTVAGSHTLSVAVTTLNGPVADTITTNNRQTAPFQVVTKGMSLPLSEGFEDTAFPPTNWVQYLAGDAYSAWGLDNTVKKKGTQSAGAFNTILIFDNSSRKEDLATPLLDLTSMANPHLTFELAYNYHLYTPPYLTANRIFADTFEVLISTDCGNTNTALLKQGGAELATFSDPTLNPLNVNSDFISPADSNWKQKYIDLSAYGTANNAIITFRYISALGGSINIDNVNVTNVVSVPKVATTIASLYPNPASDMVTVTTAKAPIQSIQVLNATGQVITTISNPSHTPSQIVNTAALPDGLYIFQVVTDNGMEAKKVVVKH